MNSLSPQNSVKKTIKTDDGVTEFFIDATTRKLHGPYIKYDIKGRLEYTMMYDNGTHVGKEEYFFENGKLSNRIDNDTGRYERYNKNGVLIADEYNDGNGSIISIDRRHNNSLLRHLTFNPAGLLHGEQYNTQYCSRYALYNHSVVKPLHFTGRKLFINGEMICDSSDIDDEKKAFYKIKHGVQFLPKELT